MIQIAAAVLLVLGSALIFKALVEMDAPSVREPKPLDHPRSSAAARTSDAAAFPLRRAA